MAKGMAVDILLRAVDRASAPIRSVMAQLRQLEQVREVGQALRQSGRDSLVAGGMMTAAGVGMAAGLIKVAEPAASLEEQLLVLRTVTVAEVGSMDAAIARSRQAALDWQSAWGDSADDFVRANYMMAGAGLNSTQALAGTRAAARLAKAAIDDHIPAASLLATVYSTVGDKTRDVELEMDSLAERMAQTQQMFQIANLGQLGAGLTNSIPAAKAAGVSYSELLTIVGALNTEGLAGPAAGTAMAGTLRQLLRASKDLGFDLARGVDGGIDFIGTLENIEKKYGQFARMTDEQKMAFQAAFGDEGVRAVQLFSGKTEMLREKLEDVAGATGVVDRTLDTLASGQAQRWRALVGQIQTARVELGEQLQPAISSLEQPLDTAVSMFRLFVREHPALTRMTGGAVVLLATVLMMAGALRITRGAWALLRGEALLTYTALGTRMLWLRAKGQLLAGALAPIWGHVLYIGRAFLYMGRAAVLSGLAMLATPWGVAIGALLAVGAAIAYVIRQWDELTGQTNTRASVTPELMKRLKEDTAFKTQWVDDAMAGDKLKQGVLRDVLPREGFDAEFWARHNQTLAAERQAQSMSGVMSSAFAGVGLGPELALAGGPQVPMIGSRQDSDEGAGMGLDSLGRLWERMLSQQAEGNAILGRLASAPPPKVTALVQIDRAELGASQSPEDEGDL